MLPDGGATTNRQIYADTRFSRNTGRHEGGAAVPA